MSAAPSRSLYRLALFGLFGGACSPSGCWSARPPSPAKSPPSSTSQRTTPALTPGGGGTATPGPPATARRHPAHRSARPSHRQPPITPTPAPTPAPGPIEYVVVGGDTWFGIAEAFGVDAFTLAQFNGRTLDDFLHVRRDAPHPAVDRRVRYPLRDRPHRRALRQELRPPVLRSPADRSAPCTPGRRHAAHAVHRDRRRRCVRARRRAAGLGLGLRARRQRAPRRHRQREGLHAPQPEQGAAGPHRHGPRAPWPGARAQRRRSARRR